MNALILWAVMSKCLNFVSINHLKQNQFITYRGAEFAEKNISMIDDNLTDAISSPSKAPEDWRAWAIWPVELPIGYDDSFCFYHLCFPCFETNELIKVSRIIWDRKILTGILISLAHVKINKCISFHYQESSSKSKIYVQRWSSFGLFIIRVELLIPYTIGRITKCYNISIT